SCGSPPRARSERTHPRGGSRGPTHAPAAPPAAGAAGPRSSIVRRGTPSPPPRRPAPRSSSALVSRRNAGRRDRKSTRLNSSHVAISYAVFCLKKKKKKRIYTIIKIHNNDTNQVKYT